MNQNNQWLVKKEDELGRGFVRVWLYRELPGGYEVAHFSSTGEMTAEVVKPGTIEVAPTMILPVFGYDRLIEAFKNQETTYHEKEVDAELRATKAHLDDMRKLVFTEPYRDLTVRRKK